MFLTREATEAELKELGVAYSESDDINELRKKLKDAKEASRLSPEDSANGDTGEESGAEAEGGNKEDEEDGADDKSEESSDTSEDEGEKKGEERITPPVQATQESPASKANEEEDYLRKYQYKKVEGNPITGGVKSDPDPGGRGAKMKAFWLKQDKVRVFIPREHGEDKSIPFSLCRNDYRLDLPKNTYLELPMGVVEIIMECQKQQVEALEPMQIVGDTNKEGALI